MRAPDNMISEKIPKLNATNLKSTAVQLPEMKKRKLKLNFSSREFSQLEMIYILFPDEYAFHYDYFII